MPDFTQKYGKPICVLLYAVLAFLAGKKHPKPLLFLLATHIAEYFLIARKIARLHAINQLSAFFNCLCFGFGWWLPIQKGWEDSLY